MPPEEKNPKTSLEQIKTPIKSLRTYQGDVDEILSKGKESATTILVAEQKRKELIPHTQIVARSSIFRNKLFIVVGMVLFFLGIITIITVYYVRSNEQVMVVQKTKALIGFSEEKTFALTGLSGKQLATKILSEKQTFKLPPNSVLYLNTLGENTDQAAVSDVLKLLAPRMPSSLSRSFEDKYMLGIYSFDKNEPFIIFTTKDFPSSFAGMLKWEKDMPLDLGEIFKIPEGLMETSSLFEDEALRNKDLRVLRDTNKNTILLYSFIDKNTLVITSNENIFTAIIGKYLISKQTE